MLPKHSTLSTVEQTVKHSIELKPFCDIYTQPVKETLGCHELVWFRPKEFLLAMSMPLLADIEKQNLLYKTMKQTEKINTDRRYHFN